MTEQSQRKTADPRSMSEIESDISASQSRIAAGVEEIVEQVQPSRVKERVTDEARSFANSEFDRAKQQFVGSDGLRWKRVAAIGGAVLGTVLFVVVLRKAAQNHGS